MGSAAIDPLRDGPPATWLQARGVGKRESLYDTQWYSKHQHLVMPYKKATKALAGDGRVLLMGGTGVGKTGLAVCLLREHWTKDAQWVHVPDLMHGIKQAMRSGDTCQVIDPILDSSLVVLDDLGAEYHTEWSRAELGYMVHRLMYSGAKLIITTNLGWRAKSEKQPGLAEVYGQRTYSRLHETECIELKGKDMRL